LLQKRGSQRFPSDDEIKEKMPAKDFYNMNAKNNMHILERLENFENREKIDLQKLLAENILTIEHIMTQTLSNTWRDELGAEYESVHAAYLHTLGNLTLTAYNREMSNKSFSEKKTIVGGFLHSKLYLNEYIKKQDSWNKNTINERAVILVEKSLMIWKPCLTNYENAKDIENTYSLTDDINFTGEKIKYFTILGQKITVDHWVHFLQQLCIILYDLEPAKFRSLLTDDDFSKKYLLQSSDESKLRYPIKIAEDLFMEGNLNTEYILFIARLFLNKLGIDVDEVTVCLRENKGNL
jgi:hypothetical protein